MPELVSCIMPTCRRDRFILAAVDCWRRQTYEPKELIILDDGEGMTISGPGIQYERIPKKMMTGSKRNACCELARGEIICHFDDDDWSDPGRIEDQVTRLKSTQKPITGYGTLLFWDTLTLQAKRYKPSLKNYICGTTFCYLKSFWQIHQFKDKQVASDNHFIYPYLSQVAASDETRFVVARIHDSHTSNKRNIKTVVHKNLIPAGFWENERLRLSNA